MHSIMDTLVVCILDSRSSTRVVSIMRSSV